MGRSGGRIIVPRVRSLLFVPGNRGDWMTKALRSGADALALDLEDAVPAGEKDHARKVTSEFLSAHGGDLWCTVRIAPADDRRCLGDLTAAVSAGAKGVSLPKVESADDVVIVDRLLSWLEDEHGLPVGSTAIIPTLETAWAIRYADQIGSASPRVALAGAVAPKGGDVERAVGYRWTPSGTESLAFRSNVLLSLRAVGMPNPLAGLWTQVADLDGLRQFATQSRNIGYDGMVVIHPSHVGPVNEAFSLTPDEVAYYQELVEALEAAEGHGRAAITFRGDMVDVAMVTTARRMLATAVL